MANLRTAHFALSSLFSIRRGPHLAPGRHDVWKVSMKYALEGAAVEVVSDAIKA